MAADDPNDMEAIRRKLREAAAKSAAMKPEERTQHRSGRFDDHPVGMDDEGNLNTDENIARKKAERETSAKQQGFDELMDSLARVSAQAHGMKGAAVEEHVRHVKENVASVVKQVDRVEGNEASRKAAAAQVEQLIDALAKMGEAGNPAGQAVGEHRDQLAKQFQGADLKTMASGLKVFAEWLARPTAQNSAAVQQLIAQLEAVMGPMAGRDLEREDAERRAEIKRGVQATMDEIFRGKKKT